MPDPRFAKLKNDPRFRKPHRRKNKVVIDERFSTVLEKAKTKKTVDKYGRLVSRNGDAENLKRFYRIDDDEPQPDYARGEGLVESSDEGSNQDLGTASDTQEEDLLLVKNGPRPFKGSALQLTDDQAAELDAQIDAYTAQEEGVAPVDSTSRFALVNLDWDHVKAQDLFRIISSVLAQDGSGFPSKALLSIQVYPSEFGKARLKREEQEGPPAEVFVRPSRDEGLDESDYLIQEQGSGDYDEDALRTYQLERLRYYYAIASFASKEACAYVYDELEGTELETSANIFDLSYVPNDMSFTDPFRDECTGDNLQGSYKGLDFATDALRHSKVKLTWEDDDPDRVNLTRRTFTRQELETADFGAYLASSDSESGHSEDDAKDRLRNLLLQGGDSDGEVWDHKHDRRQEMEVTFTPGVMDESNNDMEETTLEKYKRRQREKRLDRKAKLVNRKETSRTSPHAESTQEQIDQLTGLARSEDITHFDMTSIMKYEKLTTSKGKHKQKQKAQLLAKEPDLQEDFVLDTNDDRFSAMHTDHQFALDPPSSQFRNSKNMKGMLVGRHQDYSLPDSTKTGLPSHGSKKRRIE